MGQLGPRERRGLYRGGHVPWLARLALKSPLVIYFDDAHWLDPDSQDLLRHVAAGSGAQPVLIVLARRKQPACESLAGLTLDLLAAARRRDRRPGG